MKRFTVFIAALIVLPLVFLGACEESRKKEPVCKADSLQAVIDGHNRILTHKNLTIERLDASVRDLQRELDELKAEKK